MPPANRLNPRYCGAGLLIALLLAGVSAGVYKWTDAQGRIHYDDRNLLEQRLTLDYLNARGIPARDEATTPPEFVEAVHRRCELLRERLVSYRSATQIEGSDPGGDSYVLSPRQVQIEIALLARDESRYCAPGAAAKLYREPQPAPSPPPKVTPVQQR